MTSEKDLDGSGSTTPPAVAPSSFRFKFRYGILFVLVVVLIDFAATGMWTVERSQQGVVLRFGRVVRVCGAGFQLTLPYPFETMKKVLITEVRPMPIGFRLLAKQEGMSPIPEEVQWLTGDTNIVEIQTDVQYMVADPVHYLFKVQEQRDGDLLRSSLRKISESVLTDLVAQMKVDEVLSSGKVEIQAKSRVRIQEIVDEMELGLQVTSVNIIDVSPPLAVKRAFNDVSSAKADRERLITEADGYIKDRLPQARARANRISQLAEIYRNEVVNEAQSSARRFLQLLETYKESPELTQRRIWLESLEEILQRPEKIVYPRREGERFRLTEVK